MTNKPRDHGGGLDAAMARYGGTRAEWIDLSTGINPQPYPIDPLSDHAWTALPDAAALHRLQEAARRFWQVPEGAEIVVAPGASALIARVPLLCPKVPVHIPGPTYNEHAAAFAFHGFALTGQPDAPVRVQVHPNNPDGRLMPACDVGARPMTIIDESFCDVTPAASHMGFIGQEGVIILKSFGKFWGLAGMRLGFAICAPDMAARLREHLGPWPVAGPALEIGAAALADTDWANETRARLTQDAARLDARVSAEVVGGTDLFRLYRVDDAARWHDRLARARILSRVFPYDPTWLRLGLPGPEHWARVEAALQ